MKRQRKAVEERTSASGRVRPAARDWRARPPTCPYCEADAALVSGDKVYKEHWSKEIAARLFWACFVCDAYVGTHKDSARAAPLGSLATSDLRKLRQKVHGLLDPLWNGGGIPRPDAYAWLAKRMGIEPSRCHVGYFRDADCMAAILILTDHAADVRLRRVKPGG